MEGVEELRPFVRSARSWLFPVPLAYLLAIPLLGPAAWFVPIVISKAPLGILLCLGQDAFFHPQPVHEAAMVILHGVFWTLLGVGLFFRHKLPERVLWSMWGVVVVMLLLSLSGCGVFLGPGFNSPGNWH